MVANCPMSTLRAQRGTTLLEVLVTIVILAIGLLGLAGLQTRLQASEMEAYQRAQALILLNDMASRITTNRANAASYAAAAPTTAPLGGTGACPTTTATRQQIDAGDWCKALQGAGETLGGNNVGAMIGGRGCVEAIAAAPGEYLVTVAWQGLTPISAPPASVACGLNSYNGGSGCTGELCRRTVTTIVRIGDLAS
jgi:type IV pilus assembly protein PilV